MECLGRKTLLVCVRWIPNKDDDEGRCVGCGYKEDEHYTPAEIKFWSKSQNWRSELHMEYVPGYLGHLTLISQVDNIEKRIDFCIMADDSHPTVAMNILLREWKLDLPNIVISVAGSSSLQLTPGQQSKFREGLMKAVCSTKSWVITGGTTIGSDALVTESLKDAQMLAWMGTDAPAFHIVGIANWNCLAQHEEIGKWIASHPPDGPPFQYYHQAAAKNVDDSNAPLNRFCSHVICIEGGYRSKRAQEIVVRSSIEECLSGDPSTTADSGLVGLGKPSVLVLLAGDFDAFQRAAHAVSRGIPIVLCEGSGGACDILCQTIKTAAKNKKYVLLSNDQEIILISKMEALLNAPREKGALFPDQVFEAALHVRFVKECIRMRRLIFFYRVDRPTNHLDIAIMRALLVGNAARRSDPVELAVFWNRCDLVVREILARGGEINLRPNIFSILTTALLENKVEFIGLFLEFGLDIKRYLTSSRLAYLYQRAIKVHPPLHRMLRKACGNKKSFTLKDIYEVIYRATGARFHVEQSSSFRDPYRELCIWAVLANRMEVSEFFWARARCPMALGLISARLWATHRAALTVQEENLKEEMDACKNRYDSLALAILDECWEQNKVLASALANASHRSMGRISCIDIAGFGEAKEFIARPGVQMAIEDNWKGGMRCTLMQVLRAVFLPCFIGQMRRTASASGPAKNTAVHTLCATAADLGNLKPLAPERKQRSQMLLTDCKDSSLKESADQLDDKSVVSSVSSHVQTLEVPSESTLYEPEPSESDSHISESYSDEESEVNMDTPLVLNEALNDQDQNGLNKVDTPVVATRKRFSLRRVVKPNSPLDLIITYYMAPVTKFCTHTIAYIVFLFVFTFSLFETSSGKTSIWGVITYVFMICYAVEAARQLVTQKASWKMKLRLWSRSEWNLLDAIYLSCGLLVFPMSMYEGTIKLIALTLYCMISLLMWIRLLRFYQCSSRLGPMWIMIRKMLFETLIFMMVFGVIILSCGICLFAINVRPDDNSHYTTFQWIALRPYFMFNGNIFYDLITTGRNPKLTEIVAVFFLFIGNALLMNLLIAIYGGIFNEIIQKSDVEWKTEMYWLMKEYRGKTFMPPPLSIGETIVLWIIYFCSSDSLSDSEVSEEKRNMEKRLDRFESFCLQVMMKNRAKQRSAEQITEDLMDMIEGQIASVQDAVLQIEGLRKTVETKKQQAMEKKRAQKRRDMRRI